MFLKQQVYDEELDRVTVWHCALEEDEPFNNKYVGVYTVAQLRIFLLRILEYPLLEDHMKAVCQKGT